MSTATTPPQPAPLRSPTAGVPHARREIKLVSHSPLFYWWPVWLLGFTLAAWTYFEDNRLAIVPGAARFEQTSPAGVDPVTYKVTVNQKEMTQSLGEAAERPGNQAAFGPRVSQRSWMGPLFAFALVLTIVITGVPMRGLWSFVVIILLVVLALVLSLLNAWDPILKAIDNLHIYINMAGYLFLGTAVFAVWALSVFVFDQRNYIIFTPGQIRVCEHIGDAVRNFDTTGMTFEKQRDDLFRHIILGFGSGDLIVRTAGAQREEIKLTNVLGIGWKLDAIQEMLRERQVTTNVDGL